MLTLKIIHQIWDTAGQENKYQFQLISRSII
jgi:hypothetical protein